MRTPRRRPHSQRSINKNVKIAISDTEVEIVDMSFTSMSDKAKVEHLLNQVSTLQNKLDAANFEIKSLIDENERLDVIHNSEEGITSLLIKNSRLKREADETMAKYRAAVLNEGVEEFVKLSTYQKVKDKLTKTEKELENKRLKIERLKKYVVQVLECTPHHELYEFLKSYGNKHKDAYLQYRNKVSIFHKRLKIAELFNTYQQLGSFDEIDLYPIEQDMEYEVLKFKYQNTLKTQAFLRSQLNFLYTFMEHAGIVEWVRDYIQFLDDKARYEQGTKLNVNYQSFILTRESILPKDEEA
jgi:DNA-binding protein YbaB